MKDDIKNLKNWLDAELSINHAYYWAILGVLVGGWFWVIATIGILASLIYAIRKTRKLPKDYLKQ